MLLKRHKILYDLEDTLMAEERYNNVTIHCKDGAVTANSFILAAANPWWESVLDKDESEGVAVFMPDETRSAVRSYIDAVFHYNKLYSKCPRKKFFRVNKKGCLRELRSFEYPTVSMTILERLPRKKPPRAPAKKRMNISVIETVVPRLKRPKTDSDLNSVSQQPEYKRPIVTATKGTSTDHAVEDLLCKPLVQTDSIEALENVCPDMSNGVPSPARPDSSANYDDEPDNISLHDETNDQNFEFLENEDVQETASERSKAVKNDNVVVENERSSTISKLKQKLRELKAKGTLCLLACDGVSKAKIILNSNRTEALHGALHYFELISLDKLNILKALEHMNEEEVPSSYEAVCLKTLHVPYKNVYSLVKNFDEYHQVENEVHDIVQAHPKVTGVFQSHKEEEDHACYNNCLDIVRLPENFEFRNTDRICGLEERVTVVPNLEEHQITRYVVLSHLMNGDITDGVEVGMCHLDQKISWFKNLSPEATIGAFLRAFQDEEASSLAYNLRSTCPVVSRHMTNLKSDMEAAFRRAMKRGAHKATCRGCFDRIDCLTTEQKKHLRRHTDSCQARRDKMIDGSLTVSRETIKDGFTEVEENEEDSLTALQTEVTPQFVTFTPGLKEYLFVLTKTKKCMLLLVSREENVSMVHGASHILSSIMSVDHRRLYCRLKDQPSFRSHYASTLFLDRSKIFHKLANRTKLLDIHVYQELRAMIDKGEPLEFPEEPIQYCISKEASSEKLQISEDFEYYPYSIDHSNVIFKDGSTNQSFEVIKELSQVQLIDTVVTCQWDMETSTMVVKSKHKITQPRRKENLRSIRDIRSELGRGIEDTFDVDVDKAERLVRVDKIWSILSSLVPNTSVLQAALTSSCPYISSNLNAAYTLMKRDLVKNLGKKKEVCQCGIQWETLTNKEHVLWLVHNKSFHSTNKSEYMCPYPGCNKWQRSEAGLTGHIAQIHQGEEHICDKCGYSSKLKGIYMSHVKHCGKMVQCNICNIDIKSRLMGQHMKKKHLDGPKEPCSFCGKLYHPLVMNSHVRANHAEKKFPCSYCNKAFVSGYKLKRHEKTHLRNSP